MNLTQKDELMIGLLRQNARMPMAEIARRLSVSRTAAQARQHKLERNGVIEGYGVRLSAEFGDQRLRALVMIRFAPTNRRAIESALHDIAQVTLLYSISGKFDLAAVVSAPTMAELDRSIDTIGCLDGVDETSSSIILSTKIDR